MRPSGPSPRRRTFAVLVVLLGSVAFGGCVDKTPPPLWPTPPPPPMATPIGVPDRPASAAGGQGSEHEVELTGAEVVAPAVAAPETAVVEPSKSPEQPGALGPWQPGRTHR